ncbi:unnamed protein product, partial [Adineta steineri]
TNSEPPSTENPSSTTTTPYTGSVVTNSEAPSTENPSTTTATPYTGSVVTNSEPPSTENPSTTTTTTYTGPVITNSEPPSTGTPSRSTGSTGTIEATTIITVTGSTTTTSTTTSSTSVQTSDTTTGSTSTGSTTSGSTSTGSTTSGSTSTSSTTTSSTSTGSATTTSTTTSSTSVQTLDTTSGSTGTDSTTTTTSSTPVTLTITTTAIPPVAVGFSAPQSSYEITHMFNMALFPNPDCTNVCSATCESDLRKYLNDCLKPKLNYVGCIPQTCSESPCEIRYTMSYDGYGDVNQGDILHYLNSSTKCVFTNPTVSLKQNASCSGGSILQYQDDCKYCGDGNGHLCAVFDESKCIIRNDDISYACQCDRRTHFFRTNYEYDDRCSRKATITWEQMLALCLLLFLLLLLCCGLLGCLYRRRRMISKNSQQGPQVLGTAPTRILNTDLPRSHPIANTSDYIYQERISQYNTFPLRNQAYNRRILPPSYFNETDDRLGVLRDLINEYNLERGANPRVNITRDVDDDDEIYV